MPVAALPLGLPAPFASGGTSTSASVPDAALPLGLPAPFASGGTGSSASVPVAALPLGLPAPFASGGTSTSAAVPVAALLLGLPAPFASGVTGTSASLPVAALRRASGYVLRPAFKVGSAQAASPPAPPLSLILPIAARPLWVLDFLPFSPLYRSASQRLSRLVVTRTSASVPVAALPLGLPAPFASGGTRTSASVPVAALPRGLPAPFASGCTGTPATARPPNAFSVCSMICDHLGGTSI